MVSPPSGTFGEIMIIGVTGTQQGWNNKQLHAFCTLIRRICPTTFHHGDCVGVDELSHYMVRAIDPGTRIVIHPPENAAKRAFCLGDYIHSEKPYLERNKDIVRSISLLIGIPKEPEEVLRSGTWSTIRFARKMRKQVHILLP